MPSTSGPARATRHADRRGAGPVRRLIVVSLWGAAYLACILAIALVAVLGVLDLRIGPVVFAVYGTHGVHLGDIVIAALAAFLAVLFSVAFVLATRHS